MARDMRTNRLYRIFNNMHQRCSNPNDPSYDNYGGRGIYIWAGWHGPCGFSGFEIWALANGYSDNLDLDRFPDNDGPYSPRNCRWTSRMNNLNNTRKNRRVLAFGETKTVSEWTRDPRCVVCKRTLLNRLNAGLPAERALSTQSAKVATV